MLLINQHRMRSLQRDKFNCKRVKPNLIIAEVITGMSADKLCLFPELTYHQTTQIYHFFSKVDIFCLKSTFLITIYKSQGQTLGKLAFTSLICVQSWKIICCTIKSEKIWWPQSKNNPAKEQGELLNNSNEVFTKHIVLQLKCYLCSLYKYRLTSIEINCMIYIFKLHSWNHPLKTILIKI